MIGRAASRPASQGWMITFVDLVALCVAFFVLLHAMSAPQPQRWAGAAQALGGRLGTAAASIAQPADDPLDRVHGLLRTQLGGTAPLTRLPDRVVLTLPAAALIDAEGRLTGEGRRLAGMLAATLATTASRIDVIASPSAKDAARRPMQSWRLSYGQAAAFGAALAEAGYSRRLAAIAAGRGGATRELRIAVFEDKGDGDGV
jgi:hypothetical protein